MFQSIKTQMCYVQNEEDELEKKRQHCKFLSTFVRLQAETDCKINRRQSR